MKLKAIFVFSLTMLLIILFVLLRELYLNADEIRHSSDVVINNEFLEKLNKNRVYHYIDEDGRVHVQRRTIEIVDSLLNDFFSARFGPGAYIVTPNIRSRFMLELNKNNIDFTTVKYDGENWIKWSLDDDNLARKIYQNIITNTISEEEKMRLEDNGKPMVSDSID